MNDVSNVGNFSELFVEDNGLTIMKKINPQQKFEMKILEHLLGNDPVETIKTYCKQLNMTGLNISKIKNIRYSQSEGSIFVKQDYIVGHTLKEELNNVSYNIGLFAKSILYLKEILIAIDRLFLINSDLRIDTNLENFIVNDNRITLIDVVPPINIKFLSDNLFQDCNLRDLYKCINTQILALISYWLKPYIVNKCYDNITEHKSWLRKFLEDIFIFINTTTNFDITLDHILIKVNTNIYEKRIIAIYMYAHTEIQKEVVEKMYNELSITKLLNGDK